MAKPRETIRTMKRALQSGLRPNATSAQTQDAHASALALLQRSVQFGHDRLALRRLAIAVEAGAEVPARHWAYCARVAYVSKDRGLQDLYLAAAKLTARTTRG